MEREYPGLRPREAAAEAEASAGATSLRASAGPDRPAEGAQRVRKGADVGGLESYLRKIDR